MTNSKYYQNNGVPRTESGQPDVFRQAAVFVPFAKFVYSLPG